MPAQNAINRRLYSDDCLNVLNDELALPSGSVDLIYLDPPFNSKNHYNLPFKGKDRDTRPVEAFKDTWTWGDKEEKQLRKWENGPQTRYLADIVKLAQALEHRGGGSKKVPAGRLPAQYGDETDSNAPGAGRHGFHLPALRPYRQPLP